MKSTPQKSVLVLGGGFGGVIAARDLTKKGFDVTLLTKNDYLQYYPAMYKLIGGEDQESVKIPLSQFLPAETRVVVETIHTFDAAAKTAITTDERSYSADILVVALGSEDNYFNIPGIDEVSFTFRTFSQTLRMRERIETLFRESVDLDVDEQLINLHFAIIGGGATGVEVAGMLAEYTRELSETYKIPYSRVTLDIIERSERLLSRMPESVSRYVEAYLREQGVHVWCNRTLERGDYWTVYLRDMKLGARTIIWTAGLRPNELLSQSGMPLEKNGKVKVDEFLGVPGFSDVYVIGDNAESPQSGLAQTAMYHGGQVANIIAARSEGKEPKAIGINRVGYIIPLGKKHGVMNIFGVTLRGYIVPIFRGIVDWKFRIFGR